MKSTIMRVGLQLAEKSGHRWAHHVCIITKGGTIRAVGVNRDTRHAEVAALFKLPVGISRKIWAPGHVAWSMRFTATIGNAKPCPDCENMLRACGIRTVFYTTPDGWVKLRYPNGKAREQ